MSKQKLKPTWIGEGAEAKPLRHPWEHGHLARNGPNLVNEEFGSHAQGAIQRAT